MKGGRAARRKGNVRRSGNGSGSKGEARLRREGSQKRARGVRGALLFDSGRAVAENTNGRIMKMVPV